jgi:hypothetical protein
LVWFDEAFQRWVDDEQSEYDRIMLNAQHQEFYNDVVILLQKIVTEASSGGRGSATP